MLTTKSVGIGAETADPKPTRGVNWCGLPIKDGEDYWGPVDRDSEPMTRSVQRVVRKRRKPLGKMTEEARKAISERMRAYWSSRRSAVAETTN